MKHVTFEWKMALILAGLNQLSAAFFSDVNGIPPWLGWSDKLPWLLSGDTLEQWLELAEISPAKRNKPGFAFSLVDGIPPWSGAG